MFPPGEPLVLPQCQAGREQGRQGSCGAGQGFSWASAALSQLSSVALRLAAPFLQPSEPQQQRPLLPLLGAETVGACGPAPSLSSPWVSR